MAWTTDDLISEVRRRLRLPSTADSGGVLDSDIIASGNRAYLTQLLPFLREVMEGYGQIESDVTIVADQSDYAVPSSLLGGTFDDLLLVDTSGNEKSVDYISPRTAHLYREPGQWAYSLIGGKVRLSPTPTTAVGDLRFKGVERTELVASSRGAQVTSTTSTTIVVGGTGAFGGSGTVIIDVRDDDPPGYARTLAESTTWDGASTFTLSATPGDVAVDDWVTLDGESVVVPVPDVLHYALASFVTQALAMELGQSEVARLEMAAFGQEMAAARAALSPRARGERRTIVNRHSPSRARRGYRR